MSETKSAGAVLVAKLEAFFTSYMSMPEGYALVMALWSLHTWCFDKFSTTPYLVITAATKQSGKTRLLELAKMVSRNARMFADATAAAMFRLMEAFDGKMTIMVDEAEKLSGGQVGTLRSFMNCGYRRGQTMPRTMPGGKVQEFPVFCPKAFALIGDVYDTLRDRSVVLTLSRGVPAKEFVWSEVENEAAALVSESIQVLSRVNSVAGVMPAFLSGRDREIWAALFGLAGALGLDGATMGRLTRVAADLAAAKTAPKRRHVDMGAAEDVASDLTYGDRALVDLRSVVKAGETAIWSEVAVERMRALPEGPWRTFKGPGLDAISLASLVSRFGLVPVSIKRAGLVKRGYQVKAIAAAAAAVRS